MPRRGWVGLGICLTALTVIALDRGTADEPKSKASRVLRFPHASIAAYPNAVVSLKDSISGATYYVESDGRRLVALDRDGQPLWGIDPMKEADIVPHHGEPVIRYLDFNVRNKHRMVLLRVTCGKHDYILVNPANGAVVEALAD